METNCCAKNHSVSPSGTQPILAATPVTFGNGPVAQDTADSLYSHPDTSVGHFASESSEMMTMGHSGKEMPPAISADASGVANGAGSLHSILKSTNTFLLRKSDLVVGFAQQPMYTVTVGIGSPVWSSPVPGKGLRPAPNSPSPWPTFANDVHATCPLPNEDFNVNFEDFTNPESALDRLIRAIGPTSPSTEASPSSSFGKTNASSSEIVELEDRQGRWTEHGGAKLDSFITQKDGILTSLDDFPASRDHGTASNTNHYPQDGIIVDQTDELGSKMSETKFNTSSSPYDSLSLLPKSPRPSPLAPAAVIEDQHDRVQFQGIPLNKVTFSDRLDSQYVSSYPERHGPFDGNSTPRTNGRSMRSHVTTEGYVEVSPTDNFPSGTLSNLESMSPARIGAEFSRYPTFPSKEPASTQSSSVKANPRIPHSSSNSTIMVASGAGLVEMKPNSLQRRFVTQESTVLRARAHTDASDQLSRKDRFFPPIPLPKVSKVLSKATKLVTSHSAANFITSFGRPRAHSSPSLGSGEYDDALITVAPRRRLSTDGHGDSNWRPPTCWEMPEWQPQISDLRSSDSDIPYGEQAFEPTSSPELSPFLNSASMELPEEDSSDEEVTSPAEEDPEATPKPGEPFTKRNEEQLTHAMAQEEPRMLNYKARRVRFCEQSAGGDNNTARRVIPQWARPDPGSTSSQDGKQSAPGSCLPARPPREISPPPAIPPRNPARVSIAQASEGIAQPLSPLTEKNVVNGLEFPVFRNRILAMFTASPRGPGYGGKGNSTESQVQYMTRHTQGIFLRIAPSPVQLAVAADGASEGNDESVVVTASTGKVQGNEAQLTSSAVGLGISQVVDPITAVELQKNNWFEPAAVSGDISKYSVPGTGPAHGIATTKSVPNMSGPVAKTAAKSGAINRDPSQVIVLKKGSMYKQASLSKSMTDIPTLFQPPKRTPTIPKRFCIVPTHCFTVDVQNDPQIRALIKAARAKARQCYEDDTPHLNRF